MGLENSIVGITKFCIHPKGLRKSKLIVGGTKQINIEKIKALKPDIILCNKEENTEAIIEQLSDVAPIHVSDIYNLNDSYELIKMYGKLFEVEEKALGIIRQIQTQRKAFKSKIINHKPIKVAYFIWKNPWMVAASNTFIDDMLKEAGFINVFESLKRYPEISLDNPKLKDADIILLSSEPYPFKALDVDEMKIQFSEKEVRIIDGELFSWYGSRLTKSFGYFKILHVEK